MFTATRCHEGPQGDRERHDSRSFYEEDRKDAARVRAAGPEEHDVRAPAIDGEGGHGGDVVEDHYSRCHEEYEHGDLGEEQAFVVAGEDRQQRSGKAESGLGRVDPLLRLLDVGGREVLVGYGDAGGIDVEQPSVGGFEAPERRPHHSKVSALIYEERH